MATLYQEPFVLPLVLPEKGATSFVRAVAYLADGQSAEDLVFVNGNGNLEQVSVEFVELYAAVLGRDGRPLKDLAPEDFQILEDGARQKIARFDQVENLPIQVGFVIDNSASMVGTLEEVRRAVLAFFRKQPARRGSSRRHYLQQRAAFGGRTHTKPPCFGRRPGRPRARRPHRPV